MKNSIQRNIILSIILFSLVLIVALYLFQTLGISRVFLLYQKHHLKETAEYLEKALANEAFTDNDMYRLSSDGIKMILFDKNGKVTASNSSASDKSFYDLIPMIREAESSKGNTSFYTSVDKKLTIPQLNQEDNIFNLEDATINSYNSLNLVYLLPEQDTSVLLLSVASEPADETVHLLRFQLYLVTFCIFALALFLCVYFSRKISKPISLINSSAKGIRRGEYTLTSNNRTLSEIRELDTTLQNATTDVAKTEHFRRELLGNVSHDLRTPLTLVRGYAELIHDFPNDQSNTEYAELIINESDRLTRLVNDMLEFSKLQDTVIPLNIETFDLCDCVSDVMSRYTHIKDLNTTIGFHKNNERIIVSADRDRISQVLYNLINNAIDYTNNGHIDIIAEKENKVASVSIVDYGDGIREEDLPRIWDRYYKVDTVHKRSQISSGIGLSIVRSILEQHSVKFGVRSTKGQGSTFWFELPASEEADLN